MFCPSMQKVLPKSICDQCNLAYPSKAQMLSHRRKLHKHKRFEGANVIDLLKIESDRRINDIEVIVDHNSISKEYNALFKNGDIDWITILDDRNLNVKKYFKKQGTSVETFKVSTGGWMVPQWENK